MAAFQVPSPAVELSPWVNHQGSLPPEIDIEGNIEYKLKLIATAPDRFEHLVTQLKWRLSEGNGSAIYEIGVADDGSFVGLSPQDMEVSLQTLQRMADFLKADVTILRKVSVESTQQHNDGEEEGGGVSEDGSTTPGIVRKQLPSHSGTPRTAPEYMVVEARVTSRLVDEHHFLEIRVALVGGPDAGKSTLLGRLAHGIADNGRGKARLNLLRHRHEISSGRTSSISHEIMGFTAAGETVNYSTTNISSWQEVCESSAKVVTLLDTCGHPRFLKTTISGLTGHSPDYACLVVDSRMGGVNEMTKEHLALAVALGLPTFVVVTKMDVATRDQLRATVTALMALIRNTGPSCLPSVNGDAGSPQSQQFTQSTSSTSSSTIESNASLQKFIPVIVHQEKDLTAAVKRFSDAAIIQETNAVAIPILLLSSVTGENINLLERFLFLLPKPSLDVHGGSYSQEPACYQIEEIYNIPDIGTVVGGLLHAGRIEVYKPETQQSTLTSDIESQMRLYLGPVDRDGGFIPVVVKSIHRQRMSMRSIDSGHTATLAIEGPGLGGRVKVRRGMVVLESDTDPRGTCCQKFEAVIQVLAHEGLFGVGFQGMIHCGSVHQNAKVTKIELLPSPGQGGEDEQSASALLELEESPHKSPLIETPLSSMVRPTSRDSNRDSPHSTRSSSPSSDYGSGTGSSVPGSVPMSRSGSLPRDNFVALGGAGSTTDDQENQPRYRSRRLRQKGQESSAHGMIPISTMRTFRRLSVKNGTHSVSSSVVVKPADLNPEQPNEDNQEEQEEDAGEPSELQTGSRARVVFRFCHDVAFMREGLIMDQTPMIQPYPKLGGLRLSEPVPDGLYSGTRFEMKLERAC
ncbi:GTP binding protein [Mortierella sp. AM989]|nr:GTP binding protein [Mortierella sp. AM989]